MFYTIYLCIKFSYRKKVSKLKYISYYFSIKEAPSKNFDRGCYVKFYFEHAWLGWFLLHLVLIHASSCYKLLVSSSTLGGGICHQFFIVVSSFFVDGLPVSSPAGTFYTEAILITITQNRVKVKTRRYCLKTIIGYWRKSFTFHRIAQQYSKNKKVQYKSTNTTKIQCKAIHYNTTQHSKDGNISQQAHHAHKYKTAQPSNKSQDNAILWGFSVARTDKSKQTFQWHWSEASLSVLHPCKTQVTERNINKNYANMSPNHTPKNVVTYPSINTDASLPHPIPLRLLFSLSGVFG